MMSAEDAAMTGEADPQVTFKVKTSAEGNHSVTMAESATVADLKALLSSDAYEKVPADRQRLIYSGKVMKDEHQLSIYKIKAGNTIHMVKSAQSNAAQNPAQAAGASAGPGPRAAPGVPTNMAAGTANDPLAGLTGARYAGHVGLPGAGMFGPDGGVSLSMPMVFISHTWQLVENYANAFYLRWVPRLVKKR
jgi:ubiquilin